MLYSGWVIFYVFSKNMQGTKYNVKRQQHNGREAAMPEKAENKVKEVREKPQDHDRNYDGGSNKNP